MHPKMKPIDIKAETSGNGYWSNVKATVQCTMYDIPYINEDLNFGELRVFFDTRTWRVEDDGLIYTDPAFLEYIREAFATNDIVYSEQGMQGRNYVSFDVGSQFIQMYGENIYAE
jgi:acyl-CoA synthetase (AMP-forming)/AMP-acid ligase II